MHSAFNPKTYLETFLENFIHSNEYYNIRILRKKRRFVPWEQTFSSVLVTSYYFRTLSRILLNVSISFLRPFFPNRVQ